MAKNKLLKGRHYTGISVVFFCHDGKGNFIMAKRSDQARDERGSWDIGAGGIEFNENVIDTLKNEIKEEYCTDVLDFEFLGYRDIHREFESEPTHWISLDFKVLIDPKKVANGEPHKFSEIGLFRLGKLPKPLHSQVPIFFKLYKDKI